jgi:hypothetical protein
LLGFHGFIPNACGISLNSFPDLVTSPEEASHPRHKQKLPSRHQPSAQTEQQEATEENRQRLHKKTLEKVPTGGTNKQQSTPGVDVLKSVTAVNFKEGVTLHSELQDRY